MKIARPVLRFAASGIVAALGFVGALIVVPHKGQDIVPLWRDLLCFCCFALLAIGVAGLLVSFIWWIVADIAARRRARDIPPTSAS
jgi:hypothetical protein